jgi:hypothetical protein
LLIRHIAYWRDVLAAVVPTPRRDPTSRPSRRAGQRAAWRDTVCRSTARAGVVAIVEDPDRERGRGYYSDVALRITADDAGGQPSTWATVA